MYRPKVPAYPYVVLRDYSEFELNNLSPSISFVPHKVSQGETFQIILFGLALDRNVQICLL